MSPKNRVSQIEICRDLKSKMKVLKGSSCSSEGKEEGRERGRKTLF